VNQQPLGRRLRGPLGSVRAKSAKAGGRVRDPDLSIRVFAERPYDPMGDELEPLSAGRSSDHSRSGANPESAGAIFVNQFGGVHVCLIFIVPRERGRPKSPGNESAELLAWRGLVVANSASSNLGNEVVFAFYGHAGHPSEHGNLSDVGESVGDWTLK